MPLTPAPTAVPDDGHGLNLSREFLDPLLRADPDHHGLQRALTRLAHNDVRLAVHTVEHATTLDPDVARWLGAHHSPTVRQALWARPDRDERDVLGHLGSERSGRVRAHVLAARPDLAAVHGPDLVDAGTLEGARFVLAHRAAYDSPTITTAVRRLGSKARFRDLPARVVGNILAAAVTPGVSELVVIDDCVDGRVRSAALAGPTVPTGLVVQALHDPSLFPRLTNHRLWRERAGLTLRHVSYRRDLTPALAAQMVAMPPRWVRGSQTVPQSWGSGFSAVTTIAGWGVPADPDTTAPLAAACCGEGLEAAWARVPAGQRAAGAWVAARNPHCDRGLFAGLRPYLDATPPRVRDAYLGLLTAAAAAESGWLSHTPDWLGHFAAARTGFEMGSLLPEGCEPGWASRFSRVVVDAHLAGRLDTPPTVAAVAAPAFDLDLLCELPWEVISAALPRGAQSRERAARVLAALGPAAHDPGLLHATHAVLRSGGGLGPVAGAVRAATHTT